MTLTNVILLQKTGIPVYVLKNSDNSSEVMEAGFFAAISSYGEEIGRGDLERVNFTNRNYLISKANDIILVAYQDTYDSIDKKTDTRGYACAGFSIYL